MDAADRAVRRARLDGVELALDVVARVRGERCAGKAALLRAVVHEPALTDVEVASTGATRPVVGLALDQVLLEAIDARVDAGADRDDLVVDGALALGQRGEVTRAVVDDADRGREAELLRAAGDRERVFGTLAAAAEHRVDVDLERRVAREVL